jgi:hypothetical protein
MQFSAFPVFSSICGTFSFGQNKQPAQKQKIHIHENFSAPKIFKIKH